MLRATNFEPNWASPPGDTISDVLHERGMDVSELASELRLSRDYADGLIAGHNPVTQEVAERLQSFLGASADFWLRREALYREHSARLFRESGKAWLKALPLKDMAGFGWLSLPDDLDQRISVCLSYFGVPDVATWRDRYGNSLQLAAYRTSPTFEAEPGAVSAWFRQGELKGDAIECAPWNADFFRKTLLEIRALTKQKDPGTFLPILQKACAACGVAVVVVPTPSGCPASGATKFIRPDRALMLLSFRYLSDDHFWFTFFHEAGHLLLHGEASVFLEETRKERTITDEEREANDFARNMLIPPEMQPALRTLKTNKRSIIGFAMAAGVSPGIVVGQLQHMKRVDHSKLNFYKRRYDWSDIPS